MTAANPQSFNRYTYVLNSPTNLTDSTGMVNSHGDSRYPWEEDPFGDIPWTVAGEHPAAYTGSEPPTVSEDEALNLNEQIVAGDPQNSSTDTHEQLHAISPAGDYGPEDSQRRFGHVRGRIPKELLPLINLVQKARKPDFYILTLAALNGQGSVAVTRGCTFTVSLGGTVGNVASLMAGWLLQLDRPSEESVINFLTGPSGRRCILEPSDWFRCRSRSRNHKIP